MSMSVREQALSGLKIALDGIAGVPSLKVLRNEDVAVDQFPTLIQTDADGTQRILERADGVTVYSIDVTVEGYVSAKLSSETGPAISDLYARAWQAAKSAENTVAVIFEIIEGEMTTSLIREEGVPPHAYFGLSLDVRFGAQPDDPFTPA